MKILAFTILFVLIGASNSRVIKSFKSSQADEVKNSNESLLYLADDDESTFDGVKRRRPSSDENSDLWSVDRPSSDPFENDVDSWLDDIFNSFNKNKTSNKMTPRPSTERRYSTENRPRRTTAMPDMETSPSTESPESTLLATKSIETTRTTPRTPKGLKRKIVERIINKLVRHVQTLESNTESLGEMLWSISQRIDRLMETQAQKWYGPFRR